MKQGLKRFLVLVLAVCLCCTMLPLRALAAGEEELPADAGTAQTEGQTEEQIEGQTEEQIEGQGEEQIEGQSEEQIDAQAEEPETIWYGDDITREVAAGTDGYDFVSVYPGKAYEMSNHMVSADGGTNNSIPQTLILVPAEEDYTWQANGKYEFGESNYEVLYCCDEEIGYEDNIYYKRMNLEDSDYYDEDAAAHIRAIITNSYPYISMDEMKEALAEEGFVGAEELTRAELITAIQMAVWAYANDASELAYSRTFDVPSNPQWGTVFHDYTDEMDVWWQTGKRKFSTDENVENRINSLSDHLRGYDQVYAEKNQIIISQLTVVDAVPVQEEAGTYKVALQVKLNNSGSSESDEIYLSISVDGTEVESEKLTLGTEVYNYLVEAKNGQVIEAVVDGKQMLPLGAYFYDAKGGREVSQSLVGVAGGETEVHAEASVTLEVEENPVVGSLKLHKVDENGNSLTGAEFALYVVGQEATMYVGTYAVDANGLFTVENLLPGNYMLKETKVPEGFLAPAEDIDFAINANGETVLAAPSDMVYMENGMIAVTNIDTRITSHTVTKVWADNNNATGRRPASIVVRLRQDGRNYGAPVVLNAANGWTYTWSNLPKDHTYTVYEASVPTGYRASTVNTVGHTTITNTIRNTVTITEEDPPMAERPPVPNKVDVEEETMTILDEEVPLAEAPKTGDASTALIATIVVAGAGLLLMGRKKEAEENE